MASAMRYPAAARIKVQSLLSAARDEDAKFPAVNNSNTSSITPGRTALMAAAAAAPIVTGAPAQLLSVAGPAFYLYLQASGLSTVKKIAEDGTTGSFSPAQFVSLYTNGAVWVIYGALAQDMTVLVPNTTAVFFGLYYTSQFAKYHKESMMKWYIGSTAIVGGSAAMATMPGGLDLVGTTGCVMAVILLSSPLAVMGKVIKEKSTAALPFGASLAGFLNAGSWASYGALVAMDPYIWAPNGLGLVACTVQLSLFAMYGFPKRPEAEQSEELPEKDEPKAEKETEAEPKQSEGPK
eukprot:CAMPEP_0184482698 /NCGR_PEP_ID=MMETSP0113_2-20130426/4274_1 /TAXON_ID=91329 /ORGANISM="Norrisiella sphaerica, Strain BC52" /LENGTH=293 /DNA_ID=CAMNT_0026862591 /DNA_START=149 /DNA_END=1030 /DNA_ORIENTATION=-